MSDSVNWTFFRRCPLLSKRQTQHIHQHLPAFCYVDTRTTGVRIRVFSGSSLCRKHFLQGLIIAHSVKQFPANCRLAVKIKVKQSRNRPSVAQSVPWGLGSQISWHSARERGEVVSLTHRPPLHPGMFLVLIFTSGWIDPRAMVRSEGICHWKIQWHHRESIPGPSD